MAWLSRNNLTPSDYLIADFLNSLANDIRNWGGDVNGGGYKLTNVILSGSGGFQNVLSPMEIVPGVDSMSRVQLDQLVATVPTARWSMQKNATAEGGANAGSDFQIVRFNDAGAILGLPPVTVLRSSGFVGIGIATPLQLLHVAGGLRAEGGVFKPGSAGNLTITFQDGTPSTTTTLLQSPTLVKLSNNAIAMEFGANTNGGVVNQLVLATNGYVGLNDAAPLAQLEVGGFLRLLPTTQAAPISGLGLEIYVPQALDYARMLCFDRSGTGYRSFQIGTNNGQQLLLNKNGNVSIGDPSIAGCFLGVGTPTPTYRLHVYGLGAAESSGNIFTPSLNTNNSIFVQDSSAAVFSGGAIVFGSANFSYAAIRTVYVNGTGFGQANIAFYVRTSAGTEALTLAVQISPFGVIYNPTMPLSNPGAGTKGLWADPADGYRVKFAA